MTWPMIAGIAVLIVSFYLFRRLGRGGRLSRHPYQKHVALFSADDRAFFLPLKQAMGEEFEIFGKIHADDILIPKKKGIYRDDDSPIAGRLFDFVLCDKTNLVVACAIQLHDKTQSDPQDEPDPLQAICESLGLPWVRFQVKAHYSSEEIKGKLHQAMVKDPFFFMETDGRKEPRISNLEDIKF